MGESGQRRGQRDGVRQQARRPRARPAPAARPPGTAVTTVATARHGTLNTGRQRHDECERTQRHPADVRQKAEGAGRLPRLRHGARWPSSLEHVIRLCEPGSAQHEPPRSGVHEEPLASGGQRSRQLVRKERRRKRSTWSRRGATPRRCRPPRSSERSRFRPVPATPSRACGSGGRPRLGATILDNPNGSPWSAWRGSRTSHGHRLASLTCTHPD